MTAQPMSLAEVQRSMADAVLQPLTADDSMQATSARGDRMDQLAASFIAPNSRLTAFERLEIYNRRVLR